MDMADPMGWSTLGRVGRGPRGGMRFYGGKASFHPVLKWSRLPNCRVPRGSHLSQGQAPIPESAPTPLGTRGNQTIIVSLKLEFGF